MICLNRLCLFIFTGCLLGCTTPQIQSLGLPNNESFQTIEKATSELTPRQEYFLGRSVAATVLTNNPEIKSDSFQFYLNQLGQYLALHSARPKIFSGYRFVGVDSEDSFAMSAPGGFVFVSSGLLRSIKNEDELAGVFAHEIAHVAARHFEQNIQASNRLKLGEQLLDFLVIAAPNAAQIAAYGKGVAESANMTFNQEQELEADADAVELLERAGYFSTALLGVINRLPKGSKQKASHPSSAQRLERLMQLGKGARYSPVSATKTRYLSQIGQALKLSELNKTRGKTRQQHKQAIKHEKSLTKRQKRGGKNRRVRQK